MDLRLGMWALGAEAPPTVIEIAFTNYCQFNCPYCIDRHERDIVKAPGYMELDKRQLSQLACAGSILGVLWWVLLGGEPSIDITRLMVMIRSIKDNGMSGTLITNGWGWTEKSLQRLVMYGWDALVFSVNSHDPAIHDGMVGRRGALRRIIRDIKEIDRYRRRFQLSRPSISLNTIVTRKNYQDLDRLLETFIPYNISNYLLIDMAGNEPMAHRLRLGADCRTGFAAAIERVESMCARHGIGTNASVYRDARLMEDNDKIAYGLEETQVDEDSMAAAFCFDPWRLIKIDATGRMGVCRAGMYPDAFFQNIEDLGRHWYEGHFNRLRTELLEGKLSPLCAQCCAPVYTENRGLRDRLLSAIQRPVGRRELIDLTRRRWRMEESPFRPSVPPP